MRKRRLAAIATVIVLPMVLAELISGSTPATAFFSPGGFLWLLVGYGVPLLAIRELVVRRRLGAVSVLLVGLAYGLLNEGLLAKTVILRQGVPIPQFSGYGMVLGIGVAWAVLICLWHMIGSVFFPLLFAHTLFPDLRDRPWVPVWLAGLLASLVMLLGCASFLGASRGIHGTPLQLGILLGTMAALVAAALLLPRAGDPPQACAPAGLAPFVLGLSPALFTYIPAAMAGARAPLVLFLAVLALGVWAVARALHARRWTSGAPLLLFGLGAYTQSAALSILYGVRAGPAGAQVVLVGALSVAVLVRLALRVRCVSGQKSLSQSQ